MRSLLRSIALLGVLTAAYAPDHALAQDAAAPAAAEPAPAPALEGADAAVASGKAWFGTYDANSAINNGDNAWMLISSALVLFMTIPGLALFYGGLVRRKNVLSTMMHSFAMVGVVSVIWVAFGFAIAFGGENAFWGGLKDFTMLKGVAFDPNLVGHANRFPINLDYAPTINFAIFAMFQLMFAIITPALISGAFAERIKFSAMLLFSIGWLLLCYLPLAHMVWGKNGLFNWGFGATEWAAFDFAGGTVVHISSGIAALMTALFIGKRRGYPTEPMPPHSLVLSVIGAGMLWVGWFGFNAGSALGANGLAVLAFTNTHVAAAAAALSWPAAEWALRGKPTVLGTISGAVAGLVAVTPAAGFVEPSGALMIGIMAGIICFMSTSYLKRMLGYDDALDAFGVHGVGGTFGAIATGLFFSVDVNPNIPALNEGLYRAIVAGSHPLVFNQLKTVLFTIVYSVVVSGVLLFVIHKTVGLRPNEEEEHQGLDVALHGEEGYAELR